MKTALIILSVYIYMIGCVWSIFWAATECKKRFKNDYLRIKTNHTDLSEKDMQMWVKSWISAGLVLGGFHRCVLGGLWIVWFIAFPIYFGEKSIRYLCNLRYKNLIKNYFDELNREFEK